jgi:ATP-binding cassette subfamily B protein
MRFYDWEEGEILFGGINARDISLDALRSGIAYISQDVFMFRGTVRENLALGRGDATLDEMAAACARSQASEFIDRMPLRYETMLDENAANLSGGQKQRLAIARALLHSPKVLIMDEATSNLDSVTEKAIEKTIDELPGEVTTIVIAHRLSTIMRCDTIYVMEEGRVAERGSHAQLMARAGGVYRSLWAAQIPEAAALLEEGAS